LTRIHPVCETYAATSGKDGRMPATKIKKQRKAPTRTITVSGITPDQLVHIDALVEAGKFRSRSHLVCQAVKLMLV
jgi:hypothetical protein